MRRPPCTSFSLKAARLVGSRGPRKRLIERNFVKSCARSEAVIDSDILLNNALTYALYTAVEVGFPGPTYVDRIDFLLQPAQTWDR